jgi:predicted phosphodiesterase
MMMKNIKIVCISDTHSQHDSMPPLPDGDLLIHAGDWTRNGGLTETIEFLYWFRCQPHQYKILVAGNHDRLAEEQSHLFRSLIPFNAIYLQDSGVMIDDLKIWGTPVTPEFGNWAFNRDRHTIGAHYEAIPKDTNVLISHGPPFGIRDKMADNGPHSYLGGGQNIGCGELYDILPSLTQLRLMVFGHVHESYGTYERDGVTYINAAQLNEKNQLKNSPIILEL